MADNPTLRNLAVGSTTLISHMEPNYATNCAAMSVTDYPYAIISGGVNDIAAGSSLASIQTAITSMATIANSYGFDLYICGISPWKNDPAWTAGYQTVTDDLNAWLAAQEVALGYTYIDVYTPLEDGVSADELDSAYDVGDGIHCNNAGYKVWGATVAVSLPSLTAVTPEILMSYFWRGAVEPGRAGTGVGNVITLWRGAIQPTDYGTVPDLSGLDEAAASAAITAAGFSVGTITNTGSGGTVIAQNPAASTEQLLESSVDFTVELSESNSGGWLNQYNAYQQRKAAQEKARKEILQKVRELDGIDGEIAELMQLNQAREDENKRIAEFRALLDTEISKAELDRAGLLNKRINRAYDRAMKKATFSAIEALEREIEDAIEEEDFLFIVMSIQ